MLKPFFIFVMAGMLGVLLASQRASAQIAGGPPGAGNSRSTLGTILNSGNNPHADRGKTEHNLKAAEVGLGDADPRVRVEALRMLRDVDDPKANFLLIRALSDPDTRVKVKAIDILGSRGNTDSVPTMCQLLFLRSTEAVVKLHIAAALGRIGDSRGAKPLIEYLREVTDERGRGTAVFALGEIGDRSATDVLSTTATNDSSSTVRRLAQQALQKIDGEIPSSHPVRTAREMVPTDERLNKMRQLDQELNHY
jgi:HEAT repeat protein